MNKKSKSRTNPMAELHFVAAVQLEEAVQMVGDIADLQHEVTITEVSENEFKFRINYLPNKTKEAEIWGTLQRWQGTDTRIDASGYVIRMAETETKSGQWGGYFSILLFISAIWTISIGALIPGFLILFFGGIMAIFVLILTYAAKFEESGKVVSFRARDYLLQRIIDTFKSEEEVELYVPEISQQEQASGKR